MKLNEKASIDWNNYLKPEEITRFLNKDDKIESAENIVYDNNFKDRFKEFKKSGWTKRELTQDLANFYEAGNLNEAVVDKKIFGKKAPNINKYAKQIQNVFNELNKYGINMAPDPINQRPNTVTYVGNDQGGNRIMIDFNTNHRDFEDTDGNQVFSNVFFGMRGAKAGSYNLDSAQQTAEQLVNTLGEIGFKTQEQKANDEVDAENKRIVDNIKKQEEIQKAREKKRQNQEIIDYNKKLGKEDVEKDNSEAEVEKEETFDEALQDSLKELSKRNEINSSIHLHFTGKEDFSIDCYYISKSKYLVKSDDINVDEVMKTSNMVTYLNNLSKEYKVTACNTYTAPGEKTPEKGITLHLFT